MDEVSVPFFEVRLIEINKELTECEFWVTDDLSGYIRINVPNHVRI